ncbi:MAG: hypothetical protein JNJ95_08940 [Dechloromonas sp.]|nr:hypothetical protein [Dechloromonas sp.]
MHKFLLALTMAVALPAMALSDPPARVGRLAHLENQVDFRVDRSDQGGPATLNWPISSGAVLETGQRGRAEVWIGSTAYRLADDSQVEFSVVDDTRVDVRLSGGSLAVSILDRDQVDDVIIATPDGNVRFLTPGRYRIDVFADRSSLSVLAGRAVLDDGRRATPVAAGQKLSRWSDGNEQLGADRTNDAFDHWVGSRENLTLASQSRRHVSPHMTGYQDLDAYGDWQTLPEHGSVWYPRSVADDWAPYRYGRWAWVAPWGWTWIDQAPWGFAPFHYGRWAIIHGRWGWVPGRIVARPVYAPALVAWIGNPGWNVSFSFGAAPAVGWFPLAPREVYVPGHRHSHNYVRQINVTHISNVTIIDRAVRHGGHERFAHHGSQRAVTVVPASLVREGRAISPREIRHHDRHELGRAPLARRAPNAEWLAPVQGAVRPHNEERRDPNHRSRRDVDSQRLNAQERGMPGVEPMPRNPDRPGFRQPMPEAASGRDAEGRRDGRRGLPDTQPGAENRSRPLDASATSLPPLGAPTRPESRQPAQDVGQALPSEGRRGGFRRPVEGQTDAQGARSPVDDLPPAVRREMPPPNVDAMETQRRENTRRVPDQRSDGGIGARPSESAPPQVRREVPTPEMRTEERQPRQVLLPEEREQRREMREMRRMERQETPSPREREVPQVVRQPATPQPAPEIRTSAPPPVRDMPAPVMRAEERQPRPMIQPPEREQRREMREMQRMERQENPQPREREIPQIIRQPETPRPAPEVRIPAPQPVREMPAPRIEPLRQPVQEFRAPAPQTVPQPRVEPPRQPMPEIRVQPPAPTPMPVPQQRVEPPRQPMSQAGGQPEQRRRHGDDDDRRGR